MSNLQPELVVRPLRFTDHVPRMRDFLVLLGCSPRVTKSDLWATLVGAAGEVALHDTAKTASGGKPGETGLWFEVASAEGLAARFAEAGLGDVTATVNDEAWGRVLDVRATDGTRIGFDERPTDFYGSQVDEPTPQHGIVSMPLQYRPLPDTFERLLAAAGFVRLDGPRRVWDSNGGGLVVMQPDAGDVPPGGVRLGFRTQEPLADLAVRLQAAGYADATLSGSELTVTDPDGQSVLVLPVS